MTPEQAIEVSIKARKRAKEMLEESGEQPASFKEYLGLIEQCQNDLIQEMQDEQDKA